MLGLVEQGIFLFTHFASMVLILMDRILMINIFMLRVECVVRRPTVGKLRSER